MITLDTTRADSLGFYGQPEPTTPHLDALAARARIFDAAVSVSTWTLPAHATLWTGLHPRSHGSVSSLSEDGGEYGRPLAEELVTLPELLQRHGYQTAGFVAGPFLTPGFGFQQGFDLYAAEMDDYGLESVVIVNRLRDWITTHRRDAPLFLFLNFYDPHRPYDPPPAPPGAAIGGQRCTDPLPRNFDPASSGQLADAVEIECAKLQYVREVAAMDRALSEVLALLAAQGELDEAVVAVVGDHGESFGESGEFGHGGVGQWVQRRVPLLIARMRGARPDPAFSGRDTAVVSTARVPRTLVEALGIEAPAHWEGPSLLEPRAEALPVLSERHTRDAVYYTISFDGWSYRVVVSPDAEAYEQFHRVGSNGRDEFVPERERPEDWRRRAASAWRELTAHLGPPRSFTSHQPDLDRKVRQSLETLGYVDADAE